MSVVREVPNGSGRDFQIAGNKEYRGGKYLAENLVRRGRDRLAVLGSGVHR